MKSKVVVWNSNKLSRYYVGKLPTNVYGALLEYEQKSKLSLSSIIEVDSLQQLNNFVEAVYNETDVILSYQVL